MFDACTGFFERPSSLVIASVMDAKASGATYRFGARRRIGTSSVHGARLSAAATLVAVDAVTPAKQRRRSPAIV
jgi:hypothetical protein